MAPSTQITTAISTALASLVDLAHSRQLDRAWLEPISVAYHQMMAAHTPTAAFSQAPALLMMPEEVLQRITTLVECAPVFAMLNLCSKIFARGLTQRAMISAANAKGWKASECCIGWGLPLELMQSTHAQFSRLERGELVSDLLPRCEQLRALLPHPMSAVLSGIALSVCGQRSIREDDKPLQLVVAEGLISESEDESRNLCWAWHQVGVFHIAELLLAQGCWQAKCGVLLMVLNIAQTDRGCGMLSSGDMISAVVTLCTESESIIDIQDILSCIIYTLSFNSQAALALLEAKALAGLVKLLNIPDDYVNMLASAAFAELVSSVHFSSAVADDAVAASATVQQLALLMRNCESFDTRLAAASGITHAALHGVNGADAQQRGAMLLLIHGLKDSHRENVQVIAASTIWSLTQQDRGEDLVLECGAVQPLIAILTSGGSVELQLKVASCIRNIAFSNQGEKELLEHGAVQPLVELLTAEDGALRVKAAGALWNLAESLAGNTAVIAAGAVPVLVDISADEECDPELRQRAVGALVTRLLHEMVLMCVLQWNVTSTRAGQDAVMSSGVLRMTNLLNSQCDALILHTSLLFWNVSNTKDGQQLLSSSQLGSVLSQLILNRPTERPLCTCISPHRWVYHDARGLPLEIAMGEGELQNQVEDVMRAGVLQPLIDRLAVEEPKDAIARKRARVSSIR